MLFSSADAFAGVAYSEVSTTDTYQYVNVATKAAIKCDTGYDFQINDAKYIIDISKTSYAVVPSGSGLVFDLGKEYNVTKINVTSETVTGGIHNIVLYEGGLFAFAAESDTEVYVNGHKTEITDCGTYKTVDCTGNKKTIIQIVVK